jgi:hypothetical protein
MLLVAWWFGGFSFLLIVHRSSASIHCALTLPRLTEGPALGSAVRPIRVARLAQPGWLIEAILRKLWSLGDLLPGGPGRLAGANQGFGELGSGRFQAPRL